jgi:uncharacterized protein YoxC
MSKQITMKELKASIDGLHVKFQGLNSRVQRLQIKIQGLQTDVQELRGDFSRLEIKVDGLGNSFSNLQTSVDQYLKRTEIWHDEQVIVRARHDRLSDALVQKGIVTKEETLL